MNSLDQDRYDEAMLQYSRGDYAAAVTGLRAVLEAAPDFLDARLALGMALCRQGDYTGAIAEGRLAEKLSPAEELVHTNLSMFYMKAGERGLAEHHGARAKLLAWQKTIRQGHPAAPAAAADAAGSVPPPPKPPPTVFPAQPWKKNPPHTP